MEAVEPGRYYAFATQEGYLDPALGVDPDKMRSLGSDRERHLYSIEAWKDHLTEVSVATRRTSEVSLEIERAAEIAGTVTFDDGSPAIGMRFEAFRKTEKKGWVREGGRPEWAAEGDRQVKVRRRKRLRERKLFGIR